MAFGPAAIPELAEVIKDKDSVGRRSGFSSEWAEAAVPCLAKLLKQDDVEVRVAAAFALKQIGASGNGDPGPHRIAAGYRCGGARGGHQTPFD